jgi:hyperpolarization activated cyclic nucleotide-gated potassium channel 1
MLILLIANVIVLPVAISFFYNWESKSLLIFNLISDALFLLDIIVNFRTGDLSMLFSFNIEKKKFIISPYLLFMALRYITQ